MALSILEGANQGLRKANAEEPHSTSEFVLPDIGRADDAFYREDLNASELSTLFTPFDIKRLDSYANNLLDYHVILDLLPTVATLYFQKRLGDDMHLSAVQSSILLAIGLQRKAIEEVEV